MTEETTHQRGGNLMLRRIAAAIVTSIVSLSAALALGSTSVALEPWEGKWTESSQLYTCDAARGDWTPLVIMSKQSAGGWLAGDHGVIVFEREADPWSCEISKVTNVLDLDAWIFDLDCSQEGMEFRQRSIVMLTKNPDPQATRTIATFNLGIGPDGKVSELYQCPE
jgi:hypothetical protein